MQSFNLFLLLLLSIFFHPLLALNQDGLLLQQVKHSLSDPSASLSSWSYNDSTPCNWTGITCDTSNPIPGSVIAVNLTGFSLSGPFPTFLCRLPSLSVLSMASNSLNSSIPLSISFCRNLTYLDLSQNFLKGTIPFTLSDLPNLRYLNLDGNELSEIPANIGNFRRLEILILSGNLFNGRIPASLGNITTLKWLYLAYNPFSPTQLPQELGNLTNLEDLWLSDCNLVGSLPFSFHNLRKLINFDVSDNGLTGPIPSFFFEFKKIVQIELFNNSFTGKLPVGGWGNLTELRRFDASMNGLKGMIPDELCELPLESLHLYSNQLEGQLPESIANSPNLFELRIFDNQLTGTLPSELGKNSPLETLDVSDNQFTGRIPENLCSKGALVEFLMIDNSFFGNIPVNLGRCTSLSRVRLSNNQLSGEVPADFWGLPHVILLDLEKNVLSGNISHMIQGAKNVSTILISSNNFSGVLPNEIGMLENLIEFSASSNELSGEIPRSVVKLRTLSRLRLSNNVLSGNIPREIQSLKQLNELNVANNRLYGEIPDEIGKLLGLNYLDLSQNNFVGEIPVSLQNLKLNQLNLSYNHLSGAIPPIFNKEAYRDSLLGNPGLCGGFAGLCPAKKSDKNEVYAWFLRLTFVVAGIVLLFGIVYFRWKYKNFKKIKKSVPISRWTSFHKLGFRESEVIHCIDEDNVIGSGASGIVYKVILSNGEVVAVKKLRERSYKDETSFGNKDEFEVEVQTLGKIRHKNIVRLLCCCHSGNCKLLVYEYMPNGSLGDLLHSNKGSRLLDWPTRFRIALDAAEGLSYLHHDCVPSIVHRDVKSNNILLDGNFGAKIADFGVAKIVKVANKGAESMSTIAGSCGYIAPEYAYTLRVNEKSDIYSFGIVLLELITGRRPVDQEYGEKDLARWVSSTLEEKGIAYILDPNLDDCYKDHVIRIFQISLLCTSPLPINRPSMRRVVKMLQESGSEFMSKIEEKESKHSSPNLNCQIV